MKDFSYKGHTLNIEELPEFHISIVSKRGKKYKGTSVINDKKLIQETSTIELLISWFKSTVDYLNETFLYDQICKSWGSNYKRFEYKNRWLSITVIKRVKDGKAFYIGEFSYYLNQRWNCCNKSIESIYYDKVISKFQRFVDEYCTNWQPYDIQQANSDTELYTLSILASPDGSSYFGKCKIHKNSTFKCISASTKEIEEKWVARINQIIKHKKPVISKLDRLIEMTEELGLYEYF